MEFVFNEDTLEYNALDGMYVICTKENMEGYYISFSALSGSLLSCGTIRNTVEECKSWASDHRTQLSNEIMAIVRGGIV